MDSEDSGEEITATADMREHMRTWRMFLLNLRWMATAAIIVLIALLLLHTAG